MLYESNYNQYFLEHSWGPWKKHLYISREGESGKFTYKYPKEYYDKYKPWKGSRALDAADAIARGDTTGPTRGALAISKSRYDSTRTADQNSDYYNEYYNTSVDKVINRSVKAAVKALNFGIDMRDKAEGYLNRFANAVKNAWNSAKSPDRTRMQAGRQFVSNLWNSAKNTVTAKRISASVQNLVKGAGEAINKSWNRAKTKVSDTVDNIKDQINTRRKRQGSVLV